MSYYIAKTVSGGMDDAVARVTEALKAQGFGVLTDINVQETLKKKIGAEFRPYRILGACNPELAHKALLAEDKVGVMLPCNVILQDIGGEKIEIAAVNPLSAMGRIDNPALASIATDVSGRLRRALSAL